MEEKHPVHFSTEKKIGVTDVALSVTDVACVKCPPELCQISCSLIVMDIILQFQFKQSYNVHQNDSV